MCVITPHVKSSIQCSPPALCDSPAPAAPETARPDSAARQPARQRLSLKAALCDVPVATIEMETHSSRVYASPQALKVVWLVQPRAAHVYGRKRRHAALGYSAVACTEAEMTLVCIWCARLQRSRNQPASQSGSWRTGGPCSCGRQTRISARCFPNLPSTRRPLGAWVVPPKPCCSNVFRFGASS